MDRRAFLAVVAGSPLVFGLRDLFAQDSARAPEWYRAALARMKERKLHGVVIIAPGRVEPDQLDLGRRLRELLEGDSFEAHEVFLGGVFIVMVPALAEGCGLRKADERVDRILLDPEGRKIAAEAGDPKAFESAEAFATSFGGFLHGPAAERLKSRSEALLAAAPDEILGALRDLGAESLETRERASGILRAREPEYQPLLAWTRRNSPDPEVRARLKSILEQVYSNARKKDFGPRLPYGTRSPLFVEGCGGLIEVPSDVKEGDETNVVVDCGMGRIDGPKIRTFLRFLTK